MNDLRTVSLETVFDAIPFGLGIVDPTRRALRGVYRPGDRKAQVEGVMGAARIRLGRLRRGKLRRSRPVWRCPPRHPGRSQLLSIAVIAKLSALSRSRLGSSETELVFPTWPDWVSNLSRGSIARFHALLGCQRRPLPCLARPLRTHGGQFTVIGRPEYGWAGFAGKRSGREAD